MTAFRELSQHISDIAENGIKAGATCLEIEITEDSAQDLLSMVIRDNGSGMPPEMVARVTDPWVTTRTTRKVGLGIPFLKQTAEMCGGHFFIESELGRGTVTGASFGLHHIDRPPLGDVAGTILCLIVGNPQVDFVFRYQRDGEVYELDTRALKAVLGEDVPLSDPDVLAYLRESLAEIPQGAA